MNDSPETKRDISDVDFRRAVELIDSGDVEALRAFVDTRPRLLSDTADEYGSLAGEYFAHPKLLWFVAENPVRNGRLPSNIVAVTTALVELLRKHRVSDLENQLNYTLRLVVSGRVARESGAQAPLARVLVSAGADANGAMRPALAHAERAACETLLAAGAELTLVVAAGLGREDALNSLNKTATQETRQEALAIAATNGQATPTRILLDTGANPNQFNPEGLHPHATPLHAAISAGSLSTVCALVSRGANASIRDKRFNGDARAWARRLQREDVLELLDDAAVMVPAKDAVLSGDVDTLRQWLSVHSDRVNDTLGDNPSTLLHYTTDWPGPVPRAAESIELLVSHGADVDARFVSPESIAAETPLHWAASTDDADAALALIQAGATLDVTGGVIGNGTPLTNAVVFRKWRVAELLLDAGATISLPIVAGLGRLDLVETFFNEAGEFRNPHPSLPHLDSVSNGQLELDRAMCLAGLGGRLEVTRFLLERGADINACSPVNTTALDEAIKYGHDALAEFLGKRGGKRYAELNAGESGRAASGADFGD